MSPNTDARRYTGVQLGPVHWPFTGYSTDDKTPSMPQFANNSRPTEAANARRLLALLPALLLAACGGGGSGASGDSSGGNSGGSGGNGDPGPGAIGTVVGAARYEYVPPNPNCNGLNFDPAVRELRPIRGATVQLLDASGSEIARTVTDATGEFSFTGIEPNTTLKIRILAEVKKTSGASRWDVQVRDNVVDTSPTAPAPPPLASRPLYALDSASLDSGESGIDVTLTAETGWVGNGYINERAAAPFAVLDAVFTAMTFIEGVDSAVQFPPMDLFWSVNNTTDAEEVDVDSGELGGSFYYTGRNQLFLTGDALDDTDEFDSHIVVHEWGHYFEDNLSRSDSLGGTHFLGDKLDARLAFSEGWASALAAMALDNPSYCETGTPGTNAGFEINAESGVFGGQGWYDEVSVIRFIYDLWDTANEGTDTGSIGFEPIYETMVGPQSSTPAFTTLFSFATDLKAMLDSTGAALLDAQLGDENVDGSVLNIWGDNETNAGGASEDVLPVYTSYTAGDPPINICSNSQFDFSGDGNKLSEFRYLRVSVPQNGQYNVRVTATTPTPPTADTEDNDQSDPDMIIRRGSVFVAQLWSGADNIESTLPSEGGQGPLSLFQGTYVADLRDYRFADPDAPAGYPDTVCFDVEFTLAP